MTEQNTFSQFEQLAEQMGISFVEGKGDFAGGFCTLNGDRFIVLNRLKPMSQRLRVLARSFHELRLDQRYVIPSLQIGRASCRERVEISVVAVSLKKKKRKSKKKKKNKK